MHLIVFCDGTWNTPDQVEDGQPAPTNVVKLRNALASLDKDGREQRAYYHPGVGTDGGWWNRVAGGGLGEGLDKNIMSAYNWLARNYQVGAQIWLFGFSRGAYTVRSLGGMISRCGLLDARTASMTNGAIWSAIEDLFASYRLPEKEAEPVFATKDRPFHNVERGGACKHSVTVHFIGVWDTVGALGVPDDMAFLKLIDDPSKHSFHDTALSPIVDNARHAIAIDERRQSFTPTLWTNVQDNPRVKQVWFPGVHSDVGGGYSRCGLSDGALKWMIEEAQQLGLDFRQIGSLIAPDSSGQLHDSVIGVFKSLKTLPRDVPLFAAGNTLLHQSGWDRHKNPPLAQGDYWNTKYLYGGDAATVDVFARDRWNLTGLYLEAGVDYQFSASGEWMDGQIKCGPKGTRDGKFQIGEVMQMASTILGKAETVYTKLSGNHQADFWYTRRHEEFDWFALIGVIANGVLPRGSSTAKLDYAPHEAFLIGDKASFRPTQGGYLYTFANDAWQTYDNNRGSVRLTVRR